ncbi:alpha/beta fold hydrolase [Planctobacterium marinum]|uniref:Hydrolase n=1 Tax=Planctobacterium marinum TaxID=1631968 RepID=A0AA48HW33_9ALTE|nr:hydrolase [Planctobacterium marinum]
MLSSPSQGSATSNQLDSVAYHPEKLYRCGNIDIACDSFGDRNNPPILLIMGLSTQLIHWPEEFCRELATSGLWVIRMDNRDIGKSTRFSERRPPSFGQLLAHRWLKTPINAPYSLEDMAQDAVHLLDNLKVKKAHIVGASMGGMIAQLMAIHHPDRVLTLTNIMTTTGNKRLMHPKINALVAMARKPKNTVQSYIENGLRLWRTLHGPNLEFPEQYIRDLLLLATQRGVTAAGVLRQLSAIATAPDRSFHLKKLTLPTLIIHGDADPLLKVHNAHALKRIMPHADLLVLKGMGHTLPREYWPDIIAAIVNKTRDS